VARSQWQIVWLLAGGRPSEQVGEMTGYALTGVYCVARRYHAEGEAGIGDGRQGNPGGPRILSAEQQVELDRALEGAAPAGGRWTAAKVAAWIAERSGRRVGLPTGWRSLRRRDWRRSRPRPQHVKADPEAQAAFKPTR
jgi:transposase